MIPTLFIFRLAVSRAGVPIPTFMEVLIMMFAFQFIKEAGLRLPHPIGSAMSIVSALILGDAAVGAGIASRITIVIIALSTLSYFLIPKIQGALSFWSIIISLASAAFGLPGFFAGSLIFITQICELDSVGYPFLFPMGSTEQYSFKDVFFRGRLCELDSVGYPFLFPMGSTEQYSFKDVFFRGRLDRISKKIISRREKVD